MTMPSFYVNPEQVMKDKADFLRKNIARGRALVALSYDGGVLLSTETVSRTLRKISEIYDRIAFAGVGKYNEFDALRQGGVRWADVEGWRYSREDVHAKALANLYSQSLGQSFTNDLKPLEVEVLVAEVGPTPEDDEMYHVDYGGVIADKTGWAVLPGDNEPVDARVQEGYAVGLNLAAAAKLSLSALAGPDRTLTPTDLEVAILDRTAKRRAFRRLPDDELATLLA